MAWHWKPAIFSTLVEPYRPTVSPMIRTLSINRLKHHLSKWKVISLFLPPTIFDKTSYLSHYMQEKRVAWHPKERLPMKLAVIRSENIDGQKWTNETSVRSLLQTTRCDKTPHLSHDALKKCVRDILGNGCLWSILAVIESENIEIHLSFNKPNQRGGQKLLRE